MYYQGSCERIASRICHVYYPIGLALQLLLNDSVACKVITSASTGHDLRSSKPYYRMRGLSSMVLDRQDDPLVQAENVTKVIVNKSNETAIIDSVSFIVPNGSMF